MDTTSRRTILQLAAAVPLIAVGAGVAGAAGGPEVGKPAPDFSLPSATWDTVSLKQYRGKKIVLIEFVGAAFAPTCVANMEARGVDHAKFEALNVQVVGISSDSPFALKAQSDSLKLAYPLLSDRPPTTITRYGVLAPDKVRALRAYFLIDQQGVLRKKWLLGPKGDEQVFASEPILKAIQELPKKA
jgi:peroxiredoxin (alkyl hydroperoxide reductase subunit C)